MTGDQAAWGGGTDAMNAFETVMWRVEEASALRSTMVGIELLDGTPDWAEFVAAHAQAVARVPRLRQRVVDPPLGLAPPRWTADETFELNRHLRRVQAPSGAQWADLLAAAEASVRCDFDRTRALWEAMLYEGLPDGRSAYVLKLHHSMSDGLGVLALLRVLHSSADAPLPPDDPSAPTRSVSGRQVLLDHAVGGVRAGPAVLRRAAATTVRATVAPRATASASLRYTRSLARVLGPPGASPSPLLSGRSTTWRFASIDVDFPALSRAAKAAGGSINDAYLAGLLGGYRLYHEAMGTPAQPIPVAIPISLRAASEATGGNEIASARLSGPADVVDAAKRIELIGEQVRRARAEPALNNINVVAPALAKLPPKLMAKIAGGATRANDLQASNVPGFREPVLLAGVRVERLYGYAPLPGCPAMITLATHGDVGCVGVNYDPAAFTDGAAFVRALVAGFDEVLALAGPGAPEAIAR